MSSKLESATNRLLGLVKQSEGGTVVTPEVKKQLGVIKAELKSGALPPEVMEAAEKLLATLEGEKSVSWTSPRKAARAATKKAPKKGSNDAAILEMASSLIQQDDDEDSPEDRNQRRRLAEELARLSEQLQAMEPT